MSFSLITYNTLFNKAFPYLETIFIQEQIDIVCLQEIETNEEYLKNFKTLSLSLADFSNSFIKFGKIFGNVTLYNPSRFKFVDSGLISLPRSFLEIFLILIRGFNKPRTVLKTEFIEIKTGKKILVYNVHFTPWATNGIRIRQIKETLRDTQNIKNKSIIITGDFNFPYGRKKLGKIFHQHGFKEATDNIFITFYGSLYRFLKRWSKLDYIFYKGLKKISSKKVICKHSDHYPIIAKFELK